MTSVSPLLNTFIYTLRNQQVKQAFKNTVKKKYKNLIIRIYYFDLKN